MDVMWSYHAFSLRKYRYSGVVGVKTFHVFLLL